MTARVPVEDGSIILYGVAYSSVFSREGTPEDENE